MFFKLAKKCKKLVAGHKERKISYRVNQSLYRIESEAENGNSNINVDLYSSVFNEYPETRKILLNEGFTLVFAKDVDENVKLTRVEW